MIRVAILIFAVIRVACVDAQTTATVSGSVADASGGLVSGATLTAKSMDTGAVRTTSTLGTGRFTFSNVPAGTYEIRAAAPGFRPTVRQGVRVAVGDFAQLDFRL